MSTEDRPSTPEADAVRPRVHAMSTGRRAAVERRVDPPTPAAGAEGSAGPPAGLDVSTEDRAPEPEAGLDVSTEDRAPEPEADAVQPREHAMSAGSRAIAERHIGRFTVLGTLGRGGMGIVLRAYDETLARMVALKLLNRRFAGARQQRLLREGQALAQLSHPNVVQIYEMGMVQDQTFIAMELVSGDSLRTWQRELRPWREVLDVYLQAGRGLAAAHDQGLIHRDFKPENCIIGDDGRVRVLDFGLARGARMTPESAIRVSRVSFDSLEEAGTSLERKITQSGAVLGTLRYLPLQQLSGHPANEKSDQFSFCVSLYESLYGARPYPDSTLPELIRSLESEVLAPVSRAGVPKRLRKILLRGLSREPDDRWPSIAALLAELERAGRPRRWWPVIGAGVLVAAGVAGATLTRAPGDPCQTATNELDDTWTTADRQAVRAAFEGSGHPEAAALLERVEARLDAFAAQWADMAERSCRATFVERVQSQELFDRRVRCLLRHRSRLRSTIDSLTESQTQRQVSERTVLPFKLPAIDSCADVEALASRLPPPDDPAVREQLEQVRTQIDHANAYREIGELTRGVELAQTSVAAARDARYPPVLAEALECLGHLQANGGAVRDAQATLDEAIEVAARAKADQVAARAWALLVYALLADGKLEDAVTLERAAWAAVERGDDEIARGWLLNNLGAVYGERGDFPRSHRYLREALQVKQRALGKEHVDVGIAWANLGKAYDDHGARNDAWMAFAQARSIFERTVGPTHPYAAFAETGLGNVRRAQGKLVEAAEHHRRALAVRQAVFGPDGPQTSRSLLALGETELSLGRLAEARAHLEQALAVHEQTHGRRHARVARVLRVLAEAELAAGEGEAARAHAERAHGIAQERPEASEALARVRFTLARSLVTPAGDPARAVDLARQARQGLGTGPEAQTTRAEIDRWLAEHDPETNTPR